MVMKSDTASKRILVFAPHPDDDILGCGGSMAWHVQQGHQLKVIYLTSGESGSLDFSKDQLAALREQEAWAAALCWV
jgi:LmbE family N-acetylglucosaminyl deacetylase